MDTYGQVREQSNTDTDIFGKKRQEKALREFKQVMDDLVLMLRKATGVETAYLYWINRSREQFVLETKSTALPNVMFPDRISFENLYLNAFKEIEEPVSLKIGKELNAEDLSHYYDVTEIEHVTLLPFINNNESVAITVLESKDKVFTEDQAEMIYAYIDALRKVLNTYLEISDLHLKQEEWVDYERSLDQLNVRNHRAELVEKMLNEMQKHLHNGSVTFVAKCMNSWSSILNSATGSNTIPVGTPLETRTLAYEALEKGKPEFSIHFNNNPKRISPREANTAGATLAIPFLFHDQRQGVVLAYDENPLIFKESIKHKLINYVRLTSLQIMANNSNLDVDQPFLLNEYGALLPDVWERVVDTELKKLKNGISEQYTWMGLVTLDNISELRTRHRLEDLNHMQRDLIEKFNPGRFGITGVIGFHADYLYPFVIQSDSNDGAVHHWSRAVKNELSEPVELSNGSQVKTAIKVGFCMLDKSQEDSYEVLKNAKTALAQAMNNKDAKSKSSTGAE